MKFDINNSIQVLERTPLVLKTLLIGLDEEWVINNEGTNTWSPYDIVGHLIHGEKTDWIPRIKIILKHQQERTFESFDRFAQFENSQGKLLEDLLEEFENLRKENLKFLKSLNLSTNHFSLKGNHPDLGEVTLMELISTWTVHDLGHIRQIARVMKYLYVENIGPWKAYLKS